MFLIYEIVFYMLYKHIKKYKFCILNARIIKGELP